MVGGGAGAPLTATASPAPAAKSDQRTPEGCPRLASAALFSLFGVVEQMGRHQAQARHAARRAGGGVAFTVTVERSLRTEKSQNATNSFGLQPDA